MALLAYGTDMYTARMRLGRTPGKRQCHPMVQVLYSWDFDFHNNKKREALKRGSMVAEGKECAPNELNTAQKGCPQRHE